MMFAAARALLFQFLQPDTPLIAHAIENDLIHPAIIDTVLLYSHSNGLPIRHGFKYLSKKFLGLDIHDRGHDSKVSLIEYIFSLIALLLPSWD